MGKAYWLGKLGPVDDFGGAYKDIMIEGKTIHGTWAIMTDCSWRVMGCGRFGIGFGQKYQKQTDGRWLRIAG